MANPRELYEKIYRRQLDEHLLVSMSPTQRAMYKEREKQRMRQEMAAKIAEDMEIKEYKNPMAHTSTTYEGVFGGTTANITAENYLPTYQQATGRPPVKTAASDYGLPIPALPKGPPKPKKKPVLSFYEQLKADVEEWLKGALEISY